MVGVLVPVLVEIHYLRSGLSDVRPERSNDPPRCVLVIFATWADELDRPHSV